MATAIYPNCTCRWRSAEQIDRVATCVNHGNQGTCTALGLLRDALKRGGFKFSISIEGPNLQCIDVQENMGMSVRFSFDIHGAKK